MICVTWSIHPTPPVAKKIPAYPLNPQDPVASGPEAQRYLEEKVVNTPHLPHLPTSAKDVRKLLVLGCFLAVFPETPKRFGVFDVPKSIGLVWWSLPLPADARFPGAPVAPHPSGGD